MIEAVLKANEHFSEVEKIIANFLLNHQENLKEMSARYIASEIYVAPSTIVRFTQKLGYQGFNQFKEAYLQECHYLNTHFQQIDPNYPFDAQDKNIKIANKMGALYHEIVNDVLYLLHHDDLQRCVHLLNNSSCIYICSLGVQSDIAKTFKDKMIKIGKTVIIEDRMDEAFSIASFCKSESAFILISYSGETDALLRVAKKLKERNIPTIAITTLGETSLTKQTQETLFVSTREKLIDNLGSFGMNLSTLFLLDILYANLFNNDYPSHLFNKVKSAKEFELYRKSSNPLIKDE